MFQYRLTMSPCKIKVIQIFFDKGFMLTCEKVANRKANQKMIKTCIKSVQDWCNANNYDYELITKKPNIKIHPTLMLSDKHYSCYQYACFPSSGYDYIIYLDNDMWIVDPKSSVPLSDFGAFAEEFDEHHALIYHKILNSSALSYEPSILILSQKRANHLRDWILPRISGDIYTPGWSEYLQKWSFAKPYHVNHLPLLSLYCSKNKVTEIPKHWNTIPRRIRDISQLRTAKLIHFQSAQKIRQFYMLPLDLKCKFSALSQQV